MVPRILLILQHQTRSLPLLQAYQYLHPPAFQASLKPTYERQQHLFHTQFFIISTGIINSSTITSPAYKRGYVISSIFLLLLRQFTPSSHEHITADIDYERSHLVASFSSPYDPFLLLLIFISLHHRSLNTTLFSTPRWCTYDQYKNLLLPFLNNKSLACEAEESLSPPSSWFTFYYDWLLHCWTHFLVGLRINNGSKRSLSGNDTIRYLEASLFWSCLSWKKDWVHSRHINNKAESIQHNTMSVTKRGAWCVVQQRSHSLWQPSHSPICRETHLSFAPWHHPCVCVWCTTDMPKFDICFAWKASVSDTY